MMACEIVIASHRSYAARMMLWIKDIWIVKISRIKGERITQTGLTTAICPDLQHKYQRGALTDFQETRQPLF